MLLLLIYSFSFLGRSLKGLSFFSSCHISFTATKIYYGVVRPGCDQLTATWARDRVNSKRQKRWEKQLTPTSSHRHHKQQQHHLHHHLLFQKVPLGLRLSNSTSSSTASSPILLGVSSLIFLPFCDSYVLLSFCLFVIHIYIYIYKILLAFFFVIQILIIQFWEKVAMVSFFVKIKFIVYARHHLSLTFGSDSLLNFWKF